MDNQAQPELFKHQSVASLSSPIGKVWVVSDGERITRVSFTNPGPGRNVARPKVLTEGLRQLEAYFQGRRKRFDLPLYLVGTPYRQAIWRRLLQTTYGQVITYEQVAADVGGRPGSAGGACAINPLLILVPCHRAVGSDGLLTAYAGQIWRKRWLLQHEGALPKEA